MLALGIVVIVVIASAYCVLLFIDYLKNVGTRIEKRLEDSALKRALRRQEAEATRAQKEAKEEREKEYREYEAQLAKEAERAAIEGRIQMIRDMPAYRDWRNAILRRDNHRCIVCGATGNIEVDHRHESIYSIVRRYKIENVVQAYECKELWDLNNGAVLCKNHHEQTKSSRYRALHTTPN